MWNWDSNKQTISISIDQAYSVSFDISMDIDSLWSLKLTSRIGVIDFDLQRQKLVGPRKKDTTISGEKTCDNPFRLVKHLQKR